MSEATELAAERVARGIAWLADEGFSLTDLGPSWDTDVRDPSRCPLGKTVGYQAGKDKAVPRESIEDWNDWYDAQLLWAGSHGFRGSPDAYDPVTYDDLNVAWRAAIDRARVQADAVDTAR